MTTTKPTDRERVEALFAKFFGDRRSMLDVADVLPLLEEVRADEASMHVTARAEAEARADAKFATSGAVDFPPPWHVGGDGPFTSARYAEMGGVISRITGERIGVVNADLSFSILRALIERFGFAPASEGGPCECGHQRHDNCEMCPRGECRCETYRPATCDQLLALSMRTHADWVRDMAGVVEKAREEGAGIGRATINALEQANANAAEWMRRADEWKETAAAREATIRRIMDERDKLRDVRDALARDAQETSAIMGRQVSETLATAARRFAEKRDNVIEQLYEARANADKQREDADAWQTATSAARDERDAAQAEVTKLREEVERLREAGKVDAHPARVRFTSDGPVIEVMTHPVSIIPGGLAVTKEGRSIGTIIGVTVPDEAGVSAVVVESVLGSLSAVRVAVERALRQGESLVVCEDETERNGTVRILVHVPDPPHESLKATADRVERAARAACPIGAVPHVTVRYPQHAGGYIAHREGRFVSPKAGAQVVDANGCRFVGRFVSVDRQGRVVIDRYPDEAGRFFLVWSPQGETPPKKRHATAESAQAEAKKMAAKFPGREFYALATLGDAECTQVVHELSVMRGTSQCGGWRDGDSISDRRTDQRAITCPDCNAIPF